jgi:hypothetical protein
LKVWILSRVRGFAFHCRWFFVNRAKALAPMAAAFTGAFSTPPEALTCAPINFELAITLYFIKK